MMDKVGIAVVAEDTRAKAAVILGEDKLSHLEAAGLVLVERRRLEALERVAGTATDFIHARQGRGMFPIETRELLEKHKKKCRKLERQLIAAVNELEAIEHG